MTNKERSQIDEGAAEKASRIFRNLHFLGAAALAGAAIILPPVAVPLEAAAAFEAVHGGAWEAARRYSAKHRKKKA